MVKRGASAVDMRMGRGTPPALPPTPADMNAPLDLPLSLLSPSSAAEGVTAVIERALYAPLLDRLRAAVAAPDEAGEQLAQRTFETLGAPPEAPASEVRIDCLLAAAQLLYLRSRSAQALAPAQAAGALARRLGAWPLLRKALSFAGVMHTDVGDLPAAVACLSEALDAARHLDDPAAEAPVWSNLGLALQNAALYAEALRCHERAAALAGSEAFAVARRAAFANMASCALHLQQPGPGLRAAREAIAMNAQPVTASDCLSRAIAESNYARLLLQVGDVEQAARRAALAETHGRRHPNARGELLSLLTSGLVAVHRGEVESGLASLKRALEVGRRQVPGEVRDALAACVEAYETAGQPDIALVYLHEIQAMNERARAGHVLAQQARHLESLDDEARGPRPSGASIQATLARQRGRLQGRLGDREAVRNRMLLLEQQSVAAELHDDATGEHCYRVGRLASILGREIGLEDDVCFLIDLAARLHDIGKLVVPDAILLKPGKFTPGERALMETHTTAGAEILARSNVPQMHVAEEIARHHHERWDGTGYPMRLARTAIPIAARVTALADVFDALTHVRPYKQAWTVGDALAEILRLRGQQFDPDLTDIFLVLVPRLQREVGELDAFLAAEARHSPFIQARRQIAEALKGSDPAASLFDLRR